MKVVQNQIIFTKVQKKIYIGGVLLGVNLVQTRHVVYIYDQMKSIADWQSRSPTSVRSIVLDLRLGCVWILIRYYYNRIDNFDTSVKISWRRSWQRNLYVILKIVCMEVDKIVVLFEHTIQFICIWKDITCGFFFLTWWKYAHIWVWFLYRCYNYTCV